MTATVSVDRFVIDSRVSRLTVRAFSGGMLSALGHNPTFAARELLGEVAFSPDAPASASLSLTVQAASLALMDVVSDGDRRTIERIMFTEVLEVTKYPRIVYESPPPKTSVRMLRPGQFEV